MRAENDHNTEIVIMDFVDHVIDLGAREINVTGIASVERISSGQIWITYYVRRKGEVTVAIHIIWDRQDLLEVWRMWEEARESIMREFAEGWAGDRRRAH